MFSATYFWKQKFRLLQWVAGVIVIIGVCVIQYHPGSGNGKSEGASIVFMTILYGCVNAVVSGSAGTYCEYLYKFIEKEKGTPDWQQSIHVQNMKLYFYGIIFNVIGIFISSKTLNSKDSPYEFHWIHVVILLSKVFGGLVIGWIMKYLDNVVRSIMGALSLITAAAASALVLGNELTFNYIVGSVIVITGAQAYVWGRITTKIDSDGDNIDKQKDVELATTSTETHAETHAETLAETPPYVKKSSERKELASVMNR
jgi:drug/metabolite transporter (DMT)-like permease